MVLTENGQILHCEVLWDSGENVQFEVSIDNVHTDHCLVMRDS